MLFFPFLFFCPFFAPDQLEKLVIIKNEYRRIGGKLLSNGFIIVVEYPLCDVSLVSIYEVHWWFVPLRNDLSEYLFPIGSKTISIQPPPPLSRSPFVCKKDVKWRVSCRSLNDASGGLGWNNTKIGTFGNGWLYIIFPVGSKKCLNCSFFVCVCVCVSVRRKMSKIEDFFFCLVEV